MSTRSTTLFATSVVGKLLNVVYTVPAGFTVILKTIYVSSGAATPQKIGLSVGRPSPGVNVSLLRADATLNSPIAWEGWVVLEEADYVYVEQELAEVYLWGSGTLLPL